MSNDQPDTTAASAASAGSFYFQTTPGVWNLGAHRSGTISTLMKALYAAQPHMERAHKDRRNTHLGNTYATLGSVVEACQPALYAQGVLIMQYIDDTPPPHVLVTTELHHQPSGEWIRCQLRVRPAKDDPQALGSAITYARRYTLATIAGVLSEDDDGNAGSGRAPAPPAATRTVIKPPASTPPPSPPTPPAAPPESGVAVFAKRKADALAVLEKHIGKEKTDAAVEAIKKQQSNNVARLKSLEDMAALYTKKD